MKYEQLSSSKMSSSSPHVLNPNRLLSWDDFVGDLSFPYVVFIFMAKKILPFLMFIFCFVVELLV